MIVFLFMKKTLLLFITTLILLNFVNALDFTVEKVSSGEVMIAGLNRPATFDLKVTNNGPAETIEFYNLLGFSMFPRDKITIGAGQTEEIKMEIYPIGEFNHLGFYTFEYTIRNEAGEETRRTLTFKRIKLEDVFEIGAGDFSPESNSVDIYIRNKENFNFEELSAKFSSPFFETKKTFSIGPKERENITITLDQEDFKQLLAGFYTLKAEITTQEAKANLEGTLEFVEKDIVTTESGTYGIVINTKTIKKTNEGNVVGNAEVTVGKNIISRLFTNFDPQPDRVDRQGFRVNYFWSKDINPGETLEFTVKTNYTLPLVLILLIIAVIIIAKQYSKTNLSLRKKVAFVRAKGGEFALKVTITVKANKYVERITIFDRLPPLVKVYERFGSENPSRVDEKNKKIELTFDKLEVGEIRTLSYIVYSKVGILGKFALPSAAGIYEKDGEIHETESNRAFFVAEQRSGRDFQNE